MDEKKTPIVNRLKDFIMEHYDPLMIILYGSTARGDTDEFSDIDMMVIMDVADEEKTAAGILADTDNIVRDKHIFIRSAAGYYDQKDIPGTMLYSALGEGVILYLKPGFDKDARPAKDYEDRKRDVIRKDYLEQAGDFFKKAKEALEGSQVYRCRDFLRFAAVRALKAVFVFKDCHPPRSLDLDELLDASCDLLPGIGQFRPLIEELNGFCPGGDNQDDIRECRELADKTGTVLDGIAGLLKE